MNNILQLLMAGGQNPQQNPQEALMRLISMGRSGAMLKPGPEHRPMYPIPEWTNPRDYQMLINPQQHPDHNTYNADDVMNLREGLRRGTAYSFEDI